MNHNSSPQVVLYSRRGCRLCEQVEEMLSSLAPKALIVDVDAEPGDAVVYGDRVPVVEIDGLVALEGRFSEAQLADAIRRGSARDDRARR
ncbi:glutaredoxin family protein [bacterium]|nr:glutaredoxin family protein [bacterium]